MHRCLIFDRRVLGHTTSTGIDDFITAKWWQGKRVQVHKRKIEISALPIGSIRKEIKQFYSNEVED